MRVAALWFVIVGVGLLAAGAAWAVESKGETGGKAGTGPGAGGEGPESGSGGAGTAEEKRYVDPDRVLAGPEEYKPWEVGGSLESHRLIRQEDLGGDVGSSGSAAYQVFDHFGFGGRYDLSRANDRIGIYGGVFQFFLADPTESGYRADDVIVFYTHYFKLDDKLAFRVSPSFTVPVSWQSQRASNITNLALALGVSKVFFGHLSLDARVSGGLSVDHYTTMQDGASANGKWSLAGSIGAEFSMPFHPQLSVGAGVVDGYLWLYNPGSVPNPQMSVQQQQGAVATAGYESQPVQQTYGGQVYVQYVLPDVGGVESSIAVSLANGDPTLGYVGANHDGVTHVYLAFRDNAEAYAVLSARY